MINIDFSLAVALYIIILLGLLLVIWLFTKRQKDIGTPLEPRFIWFCTVCTYTYVNTKEDTISICPRCGSYNKK